MGVTEPMLWVPSWIPPRCKMRLPRRCINSSKGLHINNGRVWDITFPGGRWAVNAGSKGNLCFPPSTSLHPDPSLTTPPHQLQRSCSCLGWCLLVSNLLQVRIFHGCQHTFHPAAGHEAVWGRAVPLQALQHCRACSSWVRVSSVSWSDGRRKKKWKKSSRRWVSWSNLPWVDNREAGGGWCWELVGEGDGCTFL